MSAKVAFLLSVFVVVAALLPAASAADEEDEDPCLRGCEYTCGKTGISSEEIKAADTCQKKCDLCRELCLTPAIGGSETRCRNWCAPVQPRNLLTLEQKRAICKASSVKEHRERYP